MGGPGLYIRVHELAPMFGAASITIHQLVDDESGELQRRLLWSYKIWKRQKQEIESRQKADFMKLVEIYNQHIVDYPDLAVSPVPVS